MGSVEHVGNFPEHRALKSLKPTTCVGKVQRKVRVYPAFTVVKRSNQLVLNNTVLADLHWIGSCVSLCHYKSGSCPSEMCGKVRKLLQVDQTTFRRSAFHFPFQKEGTKERCSFAFFSSSIFLVYRPAFIAWSYMAETKRNGCLTFFFTVSFWEYIWQIRTIMLYFDRPSLEKVSHFLEKVTSCQILVFGIFIGTGLAFTFSQLRNAFMQTMKE